MTRMKATGFKAGGGRPAAVSTAGLQLSLAHWERHLVDRRGFLLRMAGGSLAALFPGTMPAAPEATSPAEPVADDEASLWQLIAAVQQQLFPSEPNAPGSIEIKALGYLQNILQAPDRGPDERAFILQGAVWLREIVAEQHEHGFAALEHDERERVLRHIAASEAGENWLATLLVHILEALLTDPVYGGNPDGIGWAWLKHTPGFPRPAVPYWQLPYYRV